jgi:type II secretory pathway predicted ATPase ExeA
MFLDFYRLQQQPFGVTPDPAFLYPSRTHCEALDSLTDGILGGRGFLALVAEPGMGKTTLLYQVLEGLRDTARAAYLFQTQCNSREFFQYLLSELGVDTQGMGLVGMHNKLNEMLFAEMLAGKRFVLVVDEAQNLADPVLETVRLLSDFETSHTKLLQIVLAGQPQLAEKLAQPRLAQLSQRITVLSRLEALSPEETARYINHRLRVAGYRGEPLFTPEAVAAIAESSGGIPRNINNICFNALSLGYAEGRKMVAPETVRTVVAKSSLRTVPEPLPVAARSALSADRQIAAQLPYRPLAQPLRTPWAVRTAAFASGLLLLALWLSPSILRFVESGRATAASTAEPAAPVAATAALAAPLYFAVQVGAFDKAKADLLALRFSGRYHRPVLTTTAQVGNRTLYRVRILVGTKPEAEALALSLLRDDHISAGVIAPDALR